MQPTRFGDLGLRAGDQLPRVLELRDVDEFGQRALDDAGADSVHGRDPGTHAGARTRAGPEPAADPTARATDVTTTERASRQQAVTPVQAMRLRVHQKAKATHSTASAAKMPNSQAWNGQ